MHRWRYLIKHAVDILVALVRCVVLFPLFLFVSLLIRLSFRGRPST
ncbi:MAG TPA: hypothetical protein VIK32_10470 [Candidatus Limnocylindrales bacterium]